MAWSSQRKKDGKAHCLKDDITPEKLKAIENIALDDYEYSGGPFKGVMRIDHAEQYLENLNDKVPLVSWHTWFHFACMI